MNKKIIILLFLSISTLLIGCSSAEETIMDAASSSKIKENIEYTIEQIYFSKSFQSIAPHIKASEVDGKKKISLNLGLSDYSEISIDDMKLEGDQFNIYVSGHKDPSTSNLSVPQIILELRDNSIEDFKNMDFNIIYNDYDYIDIKYNINDVLNKLESQFELALNSSPSFNLKKINDKILWEIEYTNIVSKDGEDYPLINLSANVDANTGELLEYEKENISSVIDMGSILDFNNENSFLYEKTVDIRKDKSENQLWLFDSVKKEKTLIYNCSLPISTAATSDDLSNIAFIEKNEDLNQAYIYSRDDDKVYKLQLESDFNPQIIRWKTNDLLYLLENKKNRSLIYSYDLKTNNIDLVSETNKNISNMIVGENGFIVAETKEKSTNKELSYTSDFKEYKNINKGFNPKFINNTSIAYLENDEKLDLDYLVIYDLEDEKIVSKIMEDVVAYKAGSSENIIYLKNNPNYKDFTLSNYSIGLKESTDLIDIIDKNVYYNDKENLIYLNVGLPINDENLNIIYSIKLKE